MRRLLLSLIVLLITATVVPAFAQDEAGTIADIVVASASSDQPQFTVLLAAVQAADPAVIEALSNPDENYTVFAPTDEAFAAALEALGVSAEDLLADTETLTDILLYHVVPVKLMAADVVKLDGALVGTALHESALAISLDGDNVLVNDATIQTVDIEAANGVIHVIDSVLLPPAKDDMMGMMAERLDSSLADIVVATAGADEPQFTVLLAAVQAADPSVLSELSEGGPFTVFAPTDEAFAAALEALGVSAEDLLADTETLTQILLYHVVPGELGAPTVMAVAEGGVNVATALAGTTVAIDASMDGVTVNDANVIQTDIFGTNGVIHVIDAVLLPPTAE
jgi:uncharacterized surface protein with fasciclin (FAS1) repeats